MKYIFYYTFIFLKIILLLFPAKLSAQNINEFAKELDKYIYPITIRPDLDSIKNSLPENLFQDKSIIALGESTHGTKEFNLFRSQLIKEEILKKNVKIITLETDFCSSILLNNYLLSDKIDTLKNFSHIYGIYQTQEIYDLLLWIKSYNLKQPRNNRVNVLGIDMQDPYTISEKIISNFPQLQSIDIVSFKKLEKLKQLFFAQDAKLNKLEIADYKQLSLTLESNIKSSKQIKDTILLSHYVNLLKQTLTLRDYPGFFKKADKSYSDLRDKFMAENVMWLYRQYAHNDKLILWAHNGHISHAKLEGVYRMGYYLKETIGSKYYAMGYLFDEGSVRIYDFITAKKYKNFFYPSSTKNKSAEYVLKKSNSDSYFLAIDKNNSPLLESFFRKYRYTRVIGATYQKNPNKDYYENPIGECFDGFIFFKKASAAENITKIN